MKAKQATFITTFSHKSVEWYTPPQYIEAARAVMGGIDLDPASCAQAQENVKAARYFTKDDDGLAQEWSGRVWLNPPYSKTNNKSNQGIWSRRLLCEFESGRVTQAVLLVKAAIGANWFSELFDSLPVCFTRRCIAFIPGARATKGRSKQGSAFFYLGCDVDKFAGEFSRFGRVILPELGIITKQERLL